MRESAGVHEWVYVEHYDRVYAYVEYDHFWWEGLHERSEVHIENVGIFVSTGIVSPADAGWVNALFYRADLQSSRHPTRSIPVYLDGRSSLNDISYACFTRKTLVEMRRLK